MTNKVGLHLWIYNEKSLIEVIFSDIIEIDNRNTGVSGIFYQFIGVEDVTKSIYLQEHIAKQLFESNNDIFTINKNERWSLSKEKLYKDILDRETKNKDEIEQLLQNQENRIKDIKILFNSK